VRQLRAIPKWIAGATIATMLFAAPSLAMETPAAGGPGDHDAHHEAECDAIALDSAGDLVVEGEATVPGAVLTPAIHQALEAIGSTTGEVCIDVEFVGEVLLVNGHVETCGAVTDTHDGNPGSVVIGDVPIVIGTNSSIAHATLVAEVGGGEACLVVTVTDNAVVVEARSSACVTVTQVRAGDLSLPDGDTAWSLVPTELVDPAGTLAIGTPVETGLEVEAFWDQDSDDTGSVISVVTLENCGEPPASIAPLPNTATSSGGSGSWVPIALLMVATLASAGGWLLQRVRVGRK